MNKEQKQIKKRIDQAYSKLHVLSNITWTPYRDEIFDMNKKDEKRQEITNEIRSRMVHNKPFTINDFNSFANWYNENKKI